ncbi:MAG TPA: glycyl-radical enzyme activating protein [Flavisolibacter sp.]|nr:glycyl-radical enzyme activating protein [Flavisolibacter sp.]
MNNQHYLSYFNISWLSETDGPGTRMVLFLQGCHLDCAWCHSPHSQPEKSPLLYFDALCKKCERCKTACKNDVHSFADGKHLLQRDNCIQCGECIKACPQSSPYKQSGALMLPTRRMDIDSLFEMIRPHLEILKGNGGITFSGGEPLLQSDALSELAKKCKESGFHTALETSGIVTLSSIKDVYPFIDTWLIGLRLILGPDTTKNTFLENKTRETLSFLARDLKKEIIARIPVIPGFTTTESYLEKVRKLLLDYPIKKVEFLPHNPESSHYYQAMGLSPRIEYQATEADSKYDYVSNYFN